MMMMMMMMTTSTKQNKGIQHERKWKCVSLTHTNEEENVDTERFSVTMFSECCLIVLFCDIVLICKPPNVRHCWEIKLRKFFFKNTHRSSNITCILNFFTTQVIDKNRNLCLFIQDVKFIFVCLLISSNFLLNEFLLFWLTLEIPGDLQNCVNKSVKHESKVRLQLILDVYF